MRIGSMDVRALPVALLLACTPAPAPGASGPVASSIERAADAVGVPRALLLAIAIEEGGVRLAPVRAVDPADAVPVAGALELRRGRLDTLAMGARLVGASEDALRADTELGTRAGALVVAALGAETGATDDLASWRPALERLSGMDDASARAYADRVLALVRTGGAFPARAGETIAIDPHPEVPAAPPRAAPFVLATPDYPGAQWFTTSCANKCTIGRPLGAAAVDTIVIHDTEGGWDGSVATLQNDGGKSVHYIIDADGARVGQFRPETDTTWHAGNYFYNETSIGIEHVGVASDPAGYAPALYARSQDLVRSIRTRWHVPLDRAHLIGHYQVPNGNAIAEDAPPCDGLDACENNPSYGGAGNHRDPGYYWQWCQYMQGLGGACACADTWPLWNCTTDKTEAVRCKDGQVEIETCADGCEVMPVGTEDVCHGANGGSGSGSGSGSGNGSGSGSGNGSGSGSGSASGEPGAPDGGAADPGAGGTDDGAKAGGCTAAGDPHAIGLALIALVATARRRRRRAA